MKLLLDQGLPRTAARYLRDAGHDAVHTGDCRLSTASDQVILARALAEERCIVTLDADFHALLATGQGTGPSVVRLRVEGLKAQATADLILRVLNQCSDDLDKGAVASADAFTVRLRRLPIGEV